MFHSSNSFITCYVSSQEAVPPSELNLTILSSFREYHIHAGKTEMADSLKKQFPEEEEAIDEFLKLMKVCVWAWACVCMCDIHNEPGMGVSYKVLQVDRVKPSKRHIRIPLFPPYVTMIIMAIAT